VRYEAEGELWLWAGEKAAWHFVTLPPETAAGVRALVGGRTQGWGSVRVEATIGKTSWRTSIFPDSKSGSFLLPVKAQVRAREGVAAGDRVRLAVEILL